LSANRIFWRCVQVLIENELKEVDPVRVDEDVAVQWRAISQADPKVRHVLHGPHTFVQTLVLWCWQGVGEANPGYSWALPGYGMALPP
jgi:hypothetical protein